MCVSGERLPRAGRFPALQPVPRAFAATSPVSLGEVHGHGRQTSRAGRGPSRPPSSLRAHWVPGEGASSPPTGCERSETPAASLSLRMSPGSSLVHSAIHQAETHTELTGFQRTSRWHPAPGRVVRRTPLSHSTVSSSPGGGAAPQHGPSRSVPSQPWPRCFLGLGPPSSTFHANGVAQRVTSRRLACRVRWGHSGRSICMSFLVTARCSVHHGLGLRSPAADVRTWRLLAAVRPAAVTIRGQVSV